MRSRIRYVQQVEASDCGAACLAMVLGLHGRETALREVRESLGTARGANAREIVDAARRLGLRGRGVQLDLSDMTFLPQGAVLHWGFDHFVVLDTVSRRGVRVVDPAVGPRTVLWGEVGGKFTGVALIFEPSEGFERRSGRRRELLGYFLRLGAHRPVLARTVVLSIVLQVLALALPVLVGTLVDDVVPRQDRRLLAVLAAGLAAVVVFHVATALLRSWLLSYLKTTLDAQLSLGFVDHLAELPYDFFVRRSTGDLLARFESNRNLRQILTGATLSSLIDGSLVLAYVALLLAASYALGGLVIVLGLLQIGLFLAFRRATRDRAAQELEVQGRAQGQLVEMLAGMETLKSIGAEKDAVRRWSHLFVDELNVSLARAKLASLAGALSGGLTMASPMAILLLGAWLVIDGRLTLGTMLTLNALAAGFLGPLSGLVATALQLQEARGHIERIEDVTGAPVEQEPERPARASELKGAITLEDVSFRYAPGEPWALSGIGLRIPAGRHVAIVGRSGAGKSTLARLLVGLYRPTSGRVCFDDADLATLDLAALRSRIGVVTQDARIFALSVRDNIGLGDPTASLDDVVSAARRAEIHDEIEALPMGYDTLLADGGASLSGGQRQRLALARALLRRPAILLLDEATSDLDALTEARLVETLAATGGTRITIAHRLSTVAGADLIVVLEGGRLVESGAHTELVAAGGAYAALVGAQVAPGGRPPGGA